jgi:hypothetical protein
MMHVPEEAGLQSHLSIFEAANGYFVTVMRENPKYLEIVRQTKRLPPGNPVLINPQAVEDPENPLHIQQAMGMAFFKGFPDRFVTETFVFRNWPDLVTFLSTTPMGVAQDVESAIVEEDAANGGEEAPEGSTEGSTEGEERA